jgi:uncharacterized phage-associated protein
MVNVGKYENLILVLCEKLNGKFEGKVKLYKMLYFIDFANYEYKETAASITNDKYKAIQMGPAPCNVEKILTNMAKNKTIKITTSKNKHEHDTFIFSSTKKYNPKVFSSDELKIINFVCKKYINLTGEELIAISHSQAP